MGVGRKPAYGKEPDSFGTVPEALRGEDSDTPEVKHFKMRGAGIALFFTVWFLFLPTQLAFSKAAPARTKAPAIKQPEAQSNSIDVPEPGAFGMGGAGIIVLALVAWRRGHLKIQ